MLNIVCAAVLFGQHTDALSGDRTGVSWSVRLGAFFSDVDQN
jgi:hypothetical protein